MEYFTLNNGVRIPVTGSGTNTFAKTPDRVYTGDLKDHLSAIKAGYRFFDTAEGYGNEEALGNAVKESGIPRSEFFICTKMRTREQGHLGRKEAEAAIARSLAKLQTDVIDLYLIHHYWGSDEEMIEVWKTFEEYCRKGVLRSIGVSNFTPENLQVLMSHAEIMPAVNQVKMAPGNWNHETAAFCREHGMIPMAWGPLKTDEEAAAKVQMIGDAYGKTWAQVLLRYHYQAGNISIPKSHSYEHQVQNLDIFDFGLTPEECRTIEAL